jgi:uncharacterized protein YceH (UPF0502 family)
VQLNQEAPDSAASSIAPDEGFAFDQSEIRVLAVLAEKEALTPDNYPLSLNALVNGCNQLSIRDPVMSLSEDCVQQSLHRLILRKFVGEVSQAGARVAKYEHRMRIKWLLEQDKLAILTMLMLRGIQTAGEIRSRTGRMHEFSSVMAVEAGLQFLIDKFPPLAEQFARTPGSKEFRYGHRLSIGHTEDQRQSEADPRVSSKVHIALPHVDRVTQLEQEIIRLRAEVDSLTTQFVEFKKQFD